MIEITQTKERVKTLLQTHSHLRDNDPRLICNVWADDMQRINLHPRQATAEEFMLQFIAGNITNPESIRRSRAKLQEEHKELRGKIYEQRHNKSEDIKNQLKYK